MERQNMKIKVVVYSLHVFIFGSFVSSSSSMWQHALTNVRAMILRLPRWLAGLCSLWNIQYAGLLVVSNNFWMILQRLSMICWWFFSDFLTLSVTCWFLLHKHTTRIFACLGKIWYSDGFGIISDDVLMIFWLPAKLAYKHKCSISNLQQWKMHVCNDFWMILRWIAMIFE